MKSKYIILMSLYMILLAYLPQSSQAQTQDYAWKSFRNGYLNQGYSFVNIRSLGKSESVKHFQTKGLIWGTAIVDEKNQIYVGSADKHFYSLTPEGKLRWSYRLFDKADALIDSAAALTQSGKVIIPGGDGFLHALDKESGKKLWHFKAHHGSDASHQDGSLVNSFEGNVQIGPNGLIYAGSDNGYLYAIDEQGKEVWNFKTNMMIWSSPSFDPSGKWLAFGSLDGHLYLLDANSGKLLDKHNIGSDVKSSPTHDGKQTLYVGASDNHLYSFKVTPELRLKKVWRYKTGGEVYSSPALKDNRIVFASLDGTEYCLTTEGKLVWKFPIYAPISSSPLITADNTVIFGASNGKLYSLDLESGERLWSYRTTDNKFKSNLDASVTLTTEGHLWVGSYNGKVYRVPYNYCSENPTDNHCEFGGHKDLPTFVKTYAPMTAEATLVYEDAHGNYFAEPEKLINAEEMMRWRLIVKENDDYLTTASISSRDLKITTNPPIRINHKISSDGKYLNLIPEKFYSANQIIEVNITGNYYLSNHWLLNRLRLFERGKFKHQFRFSTKPEAKSVLNKLIGAKKIYTWGLKSLFLLQPRALDTYIPAALDGQGFVTTAFGFNPDKSHFFMLGFPALPTETGVKLLPEPSKVFILKGFSQGNSLRARGRFKLSAMGGTMDFKEFEVFGKLNHQGGFEQLDFIAEASCLSLQGNQGNYSFPISLAHLVCNEDLDVISVGTSRYAKPLKKLMPSTVQLLRHRTERRSEKVNLKNTDNDLKTSHLLSVVRYNTDTHQIIQWGSKVIQPQDFKFQETQFSVPLKTLSHVPANQTTIFWDSELLSVIK